MSDPLILAVDRLTMRFGGIVAVNELSFSAARRQVTALIGPNGAGKTTVFNCITGFYKPTGGTLRLTREGAAEIALERLNDFRISKQAKVARTFQNIRLFPGMTALENLMVAQHNALMLASGFTFLGLIGVPSYRAAEKRAIDLSKFWLQRIGLLDLIDRDAMHRGHLVRVGNQCRARSHPDHDRGDEIAGAFEAARHLLPVGRS